MKKNTEKQIHAASDTAADTLPQKKGSENLNELIKNLITLTKGDILVWNMYRENYPLTSKFKDCTIIVYAACYPKDTNVLIILDENRNRIIFDFDEYEKEENSSRIKGLYIAACYSFRKNLLKRPRKNSGIDELFRRMAEEREEIKKQAIEIEKTLNIF